MRGAAARPRENCRGRERRCVGCSAAFMVGSPAVTARDQEVSLRLATAAALAGHSVQGHAEAVVPHC